MSKARRVWIQWKCTHCGRSYKDDVFGNLYANNRRYTLSWKCAKCGKKNRIVIDLKVISEDYYTDSSFYY